VAPHRDADDLVQELGLRREDGVERALGDTGLGGDPLQGRREVAVAQEEPLAGGADPPAGVAQPF